MTLKPTTMPGIVLPPMAVDSMTMESPASMMIITSLLRFSQSQTQEKTEERTQPVCEEECCETVSTYSSSNKGGELEGTSVTAIAGDIGGINKRRDFGAFGNGFGNDFYPEFNDNNQNNNQNVNINQNANANANIFKGFNDFGFFGNEDFGFGSGIFPCFAAENGFQFDSAVAYGLDNTEGADIIV
ncbi:hypothetical protein BGX38DRAFT_340016 [Terfezia claveryi]|nr:hypothetical protein BGX38DRAFT_340016 [Terfezia claveryi]